MVPIYSDHLAHYGINGMKWGVRRFQNEDGSYKEAGERRYGPNGSAPSGAYEDAAKRKKLSKAAKIGLGVAGAAAIAGGAYALTRTSGGRKMLAKVQQNSAVKQNLRDAAKIDKLMSAKSMAQNRLDDLADSKGIRNAIAKKTNAKIISRNQSMADHLVDRQKIRMAKANASMAKSDMYQDSVFKALRNDMRYGMHKTEGIDAYTKDIRRLKNGKLAVKSPTQLDLSGSYKVKSKSGPWSVKVAEAAKATEVSPPAAEVLKDKSVELVKTPKAPSSFKTKISSLKSKLGSKKSSSLAEATAEYSKKAKEVASKADDALDAVKTAPGKIDKIRTRDRVRRANAAKFNKQVSRAKNSLSSTVSKTNKLASSSVNKVGRTIRRTKATLAGNPAYSYAIRQIQ